ncbi:MAG: hypothetical protein ILO34_04720 [Kiritimatiellae bacterium]|nr:hypothetical protein [Kiritimatiellia bacterium]
MAAITSNEVKLSMDWGTEVKALDYSYGSRPCDFQDLMINISENRATTVEGEIAPLSAKIKIRNKELEILSDLLAIFTETQSKYASDASGSATAGVSGVTEEMVPLASDAYRRKGGSPSSALSWWNSSWTKASVEGMLKELKSMIDSRNNASQKDMTRLQSLVDRRDESFSTASSLMSAVSDTRSNLIRNL